MKRCGRRRRCWRASRATRRSTARRPTIRPRCWCGTRRPRCTSAFAPRRRPDSVRATLADRDRIQSDDHVIIFLSTYNDGRQAMVFGVNPLGVQLDGALAEGTRGTGGGFTGLATGPRNARPQSRLRVSIEGPRHRLRLRGRSPHSVQERPLSIGSRSRTGASTSRASSRSAASKTAGSPARRNEASFLSQAGRLKNLTDLRRGLVLDLNPIATTKLDGAPSADGWNYDASRPEFGMNLRWGITPNLTMNGTINPDFSQVESDAGQFSFDPRQALFFPEKRPFFLDGIEQFATPEQPDLHAPRGGAARRDQAHRPDRRPHQHRLPRGGRRPVAVGDRRRSSDLQHPARAAGRRRQVESGAGLHRSHRRQSLESRRLAPMRAWSGSDIYSLTMQGALSRTTANGGRDHRAVVAGRVRARRPAIRHALHRARRRSGFQGGGRLHLAHRRGLGQLQSPADHLRPQGQRARALVERRRGRRHLAVRRR